MKCTEFKISFGKCVYSCNHHPNQVTNINITPESSLEVNHPLSWATIAQISPLIHFVFDFL